MIKSKENLISNELAKRKIDILTATETWLQETKQDETWVAACELGSPSFQIFTKNRSSQRGGGIALIRNNNCKVSQQKDVHVYSTLEHNIWNTQLRLRVYTIIGIYHPLQSTDQQFNNSNFIEQFTDLLTEELPKQQDLIIMGDIHIHLNDSEDQDAQTLLNTIAAFNLKQHDNIPTYNLGHTLDVIITPATYHGSLIGGMIHIRSQVHNTGNLIYKA